MCAKTPIKKTVAPVKRAGLGKVTSPYVGETEKNLNRVLKPAEKESVVLLLDEADALFAKRTEVKDAHDRYANQETSLIRKKKMKGKN